MPSPRQERSVLGDWWWSVDRALLGMLLLLIVVGTLMLFAASPAVAARIGLDELYFVQRHLLMLPLVLAVLIGVSMLSPLGVRRLGVVLLGAAYGLLVLTLLIGEEIKGAQRWINLAGFSLQASELLKPALTVACAWMFAEWHRNPAFKGQIFATILYGMAVLLLLAQPDVGMTILISVIWWSQFYMAGLGTRWILVMVVMAMLAAVGGYALFPHVQSRVDRFLDPTTGDTFQVDQSLKAIQQGGWFGVGPGEGRVKSHLPDAHADFIFAVAGEEFGIIACILVVGIFLAIVLRGMRHVWHESNMFVALATQGLLLQFFLQAFINIASSLNLIPTKGMTLPFVSYGGSSLLGMAIGMGMVLALTRRRLSVRVRL